MNKSIQSIRDFLPSLALGWGGPAAAAGLTAMGITLPVASVAALGVAATAGYLALKRKEQLDDDAQAEQLQQAIDAVRGHAESGEDDHAKLTAQLGNLGYDLRLSHEQLKQRIASLEALLAEPDRPAEDLRTFFQQAEGSRKDLFVSLAKFLEANFDELREHLTALGDSVEALRADVDQVLSKLENIQDDVKHVIGQNNQQIALLQELIRLQNITDKDRRAELEAELRPQLEASIRNKLIQNPQIDAESPEQIAEALIQAIKRPGVAEAAEKEGDNPLAAAKELLRQGQALDDQTAKLEEESVTLKQDAARIAALAGDLVLATDAWRAVLQTHPKDVNAWNKLGHLLITQGQLDEATACCEKLTELRPDDPESLAISLGNLGAIALTRGNLDEAHRLLTESLEIFRQIGLLEGQANQLGNLGLIARARGDLDEAQRRLTEALDIFRQLGNLEGQANQLGNLGAIARARGDQEQACQLWREALALFTQVGMRPQAEQTRELLQQAGCE